MAETDTKAPCQGQTGGPSQRSLGERNRKAYQASIEATASDPTPPDYIFTGPGELLLVKGDYGHVRWSRPVPDVWLRLDQLESCG